METYTVVSDTSTERWRVCTDHPDFMQAVRDFVTDWHREPSLEEVCVFVNTTTDFKAFTDKQVEALLSSIDVGSMDTFTLMCRFHVMQGLGHLSFEDACSKIAESE